MAMRGRASKYWIESLAWVLGAVVVYGLTYQFDEVNPQYEFGPAHWPRALLIGVMISAAVLWRFPGGATGNGGEDSPSAQEGKSPPKMTVRDKVRRFGIFAVPVLYVFFMDKFGFLLVTPFFLVGYMYLLGYRNWPRLLGVCIGIYCVVVSLFVVLMSTPLPQGVGIFYSLNGYLLNFLQ